MLSRAHHCPAFFFGDADGPLREQGRSLPLELQRCYDPPNLWLREGRDLGGQGYGFGGLLVQVSKQGVEGSIRLPLPHRALATSGEVLGARPRLRITSQF